MFETIRMSTVAIALVVISLPGAAQSPSPRLEIQGPSRPGGAGSLDGVQWRATSLGDTAVPTEGRAPVLVFTAGGGLRGSDGCNRLMGGYAIDGDRLTFKPVAATQRACPGMDEVPRALGRVFQETRGWRIPAPGLLELLGADGDVIGRFTATANASQG